LLIRWLDSGVSDMTLLSTISNESVNENLKKRFENSEIYVRLCCLLRGRNPSTESQPFKTYIGHVLISVNVRSRTFASYTCLPVG
jgi:myosin heavy subunit